MTARYLVVTKPYGSPWYRPIALYTHPRSALTRARTHRAMGEKAHVRVLTDYPTPEN